MHEGEREAGEQEENPAVGEGQVDQTGIGSVEQEQQDQQEEDPAVDDDGSVHHARFH